MPLRELSESEWQHSFVPVLKLSGPGSNTPGGENNPRAREHAVGDVKHVMVSTTVHHHQTLLHSVYVCIWVPCMKGSL